MCRIVPLSMSKSIATVGIRLYYSCRATLRTQPGNNRCHGRWRTWYCAGIWHVSSQLKKACHARRDKRTNSVPGAQHPRRQTGVFLSWKKPVHLKPKAQPRHQPQLGNRNCSSHQHRCGQFAHMGNALVVAKCNRYGKAVRNK